MPPAFVARFPPIWQLPSPPRLSGKYRPALLAACSADATGPDLSRAERWDEVLLRIDEDFPRVAGVSVVELSRELASGEAPVLLDVRSADEFAVSRLDGARRAGTGRARTRPSADL